MRISRERIAYSLVRRILRWGVRKSNFTDHAEREMGPAPKEDGPDRWMNLHLLDMVRLFALEGHSGMSAGIARQRLGLLLDYKPLGPLTGEDGEWSESFSGVLQNRRCTAVFRDPESMVTYFIDGFIFRGPEGECWTSRVSFRILQLPCAIPESLYIDVSPDSSSEERINAIRSAGIPDAEIYALT